MKLIMENRQDRRQLKEILGYEEDKWERIANGEEPLEVSKYFEEKIKKALYKIKQEIQETTAVGQLLLQILRGSALSKEETKFVKDQLLDVFGSVALASIFMMPGGSVAVVPLIALAKKYDIPLIPSAFRENLKQSGMKLLFENWRQYLEEDVGGFTAEYQLFIPRKCPDLKCEPSKLSSAPPVENRSGINKPFGGFWTSTANKEKTWTSSWNEWMKGEMPHWMHPKGILLRPKTDNVFHIENDRDAKLLHEEFPLESEGPSFSFSAFSGPSKHNIDFEAALKKYDGIHWGMKDGDHSRSSSFGRSGMWDVESTVWRDASVLEVVEVVEVAQREASDDIY